MIGWGWVRATAFPVLVAFAGLTVGTVFIMQGIDALPEHGPHVEYSATMPSSPRVGAVLSTMGFSAVLGPDQISQSQGYGEVQ